MKRDTVKKILIYFFLIAGALIMIFPFYWMVASSFKTNEEFFAARPVWVPGNWFNFDNFTRAITQSSLGRYFMNSVIVTFSSVVLTTIVTILGSFCAAAAADVPSSRPAAGAVSPACAAEEAVSPSTAVAAVTAVSEEAPSCACVPGAA